MRKQGDWLNNRGKYDLSITDFWVLLLVGFIIAGTISSWWLFLLILWGRMWIILSDASTDLQMRKSIRDKEKIMIDEKVNQSLKP